MNGWFFLLLSVLWNTLYVAICDKSDTFEWVKDSHSINIFKLKVFKIDFFWGRGVKLITLKWIKRDKSSIISETILKFKNVGLKHWAKYVSILLEKKLLRKKETKIENYYHSSKNAKPVKKWRKKNFPSKEITTFSFFNWWRNLFRIFKNIMVIQMKIKMEKK